MAAYAYKYVRDLLPPWLTEVEGYEGEANYDGDQWYAAADYIQELEKLISKIQPVLKEHRVYDWIKNRPKTSYT